MRPILFLHIPRTGGMSLKEMCVGTFGLQRSLTDAHLHDLFDKFGGADLRRYDFVEGHVPPRFFKRTSVRDAWPANGYTLVREPVARTVSQAMGARRRRAHVRGDEWKDLLVPEVRDPDALFERLPLLCNTQTKLLASHNPLRADEGLSTFMAAKAALDRIAFGLTEEFAVAMALFSDRFGVSFPDLVHTNASPARGDDDLRDAAFRDAARAHNELDVKLYDHAARRFREAVRTWCDGLLGLGADDGLVRLDLAAPASSAGGAIFVSPYAGSVRIAGSLLLAGKPAEAAIARVGEQVTPIGSRYASMRVAEETRDADNRFAGVRGLVEVPEGARRMEIIAFDRTRRLRGAVELEVVSVDGPPPAGEVTPPREVAARTAAAREVAARTAVPPPGRSVASGTGRGGEMGRRWLALLQELGLRRSSRVLELCCGPGWFAGALAGFLDRDGGYTGCDDDDAAIARLRHEYGSQVPAFRFDRVAPPRVRGRRERLLHVFGRAGASRWLPYDDDAFDVVCGFGPFSRVGLGELRRRLAEAARVTRPGGLGVFLVNVVSDVDERPVRIDDLAYAPAGDGVHASGPPGSPHRHLALEPGALERVLRAEGWTLVECIAGAWHRRAGPGGPTVPFHGSDVCVCRPTLVKPPRRSG